PTPTPAPTFSVNLPEATTNICGTVLEGISEKTTVSSFVSAFELDHARVEVLNKSGKVITGSEIVSTGCKVNIISENDGKILGSYTVILYGDVTGDGLINSLDFVYIKRHVWNIAVLEGAALLAGSISSKDKSAVSTVTSYDFVLIKRHVWNIANIVQPK
ncbi:MAG: dockerin type I repeat-containing protein, partial [Clostridia bacterium]|nr:dockerin type I repeat-containing protein [Clostridia bacterium]